MGLKEISARFNIYYLMIFALAVLILFCAFWPGYGFKAQALIPVVISILTCALLDIPLKYYKHKKWEFPHCAIISGLFVGGLLAQNLPFYVYIAASAVAILSKYLIRFRGKHIFNPANLGVLLAVLVFPRSADSWWIASPVVLVVILGIAIAWKMKRFDLVLSFLIPYFIISNVLSIMDGEMLNSVYYSFINAGMVYFFAMYMLIEPKTHPLLRKQRIFYGILLGVVYAFSEVYFQIGLLMLLAVGNVLVPFLNNMTPKPAQEPGKA